MLKQIIVKTPLHKIAKELQERRELSKFSKIDNRLTGYRTVYSISPYKTATRFIAGCYRKEISAHEPIDYTSLKNFQNGFNSFFVRRMNTLNLKLECSGYFSAYLDQLASHPIVKDFEFICVLRKPSSWITSAITNWILLEREGYWYNYTNDLFWKNIIGVDLSKFLSKSESEKEAIVLRMADFYMTYLEKTRLLANVHYVDIHEIEGFLPILDDLIAERSNPNKDRIASNKVKPYVFSDGELDKRYEKLIQDFV